MKTLRKVIVILVLTWQVVSFFAPSITAHASETQETAVCFYPGAAKSYGDGLYVFPTTDPTQKMWLVLTGTNKGGIITTDDGGYNNPVLNKLFYWLTQPRTTSAESAQSTQALGKPVCFLPNTAKHYSGWLNGKPYAGYTFAIVGRPNAHLVLELRGTPGLIVCDSSKAAPDKLDRMFPALGC